MSVSKCVNSKEYARNAFYYNEAGTGSTISSAEDALLQPGLKWNDAFGYGFHFYGYDPKDAEVLLNIAACWVWNVAEVATWRCYGNKIWLMLSWIITLVSQANQIVVVFDQSTIGLIETPPLRSWERSCRWETVVARNSFEYIASN